MSDDLLAKLRAKRREALARGVGEVGRALSVAPAAAVSKAEELWCRLAVERPGAKRSLRPVQVEMLVRAVRAQGLLAGVGVGHGKTLVTLTVSRLIDCARPLLLVPSARVRDKTLREALEYDDEFWLDERLQIMTYGELSSGRGEAKLAELRPDLLIAAAAHMLGRPGSSARTGRMARYVKEHAPKFIALTGTLIKTSLRDYAHLAAWTLGEGSPLPRPCDHRALERWSLCIDTDQTDVWPTASDWSSMQALVDRWGRAEDLTGQRVRRKRELVREAYQRRLRAAEGVVLTEDLSSDVELVLGRLSATRPDKVLDALDQLEA